jgi:hypothetical protein
MGHDVPLAILDKALRRMKWEPDLTPEMDRYLAEQARELVAGGQLRAVPDIAKGLNKEFIRKAMAAR